MTRRWIYGGLILFVLTTSSQAQDKAPRTDRARLLRALDTIPDLQAVGDPSEFTASTIDQLDPTLAQELKLYGLKGVTIRQWTATNSGTAKVTLFEMLDSPAAYGVYTLQRSRLGGGATPMLIGAASFQHGSQLYFWQSNYAVRIDAPARFQNILAQTLSRNILGRSQKPPVSEYLPATDLVEGTERYVLSPDLIDRAAGLDPQALGFDQSAEAATGTYRVDGAQAKLVLVLYPTQHIARKYADMLNVASPFTKRAGPLLAVVYASRDERVAASILDGVSHEFKVTWDQPRPDLGLGTMLVTIFTFIGIALVFTTIVGVSYGGLRVFVKSRYPNRVFDRAETMEIIQLKLIQGVTNRQIGGNGDASNT